MKNRISPHKKQHGFTIIELMIATTIFALVLMICLAAIMTITRMYYQGTLQARTQNRVREIVDEVADEIRYRPGSLIITSGPAILPDAPEQENGDTGSVDATQPDNYFGQYCIGSIRYRYLLGYKTLESAVAAAAQSEDRNAARPLIRENVLSECGDTSDLDTNTKVVNEFIENNQDNSMLDENMRILEFDISRVNNSDNYKVAVTIAYGADDLIGFENGNFICRPNNVARAYCATSRLEVVVTRRFK